MDLKSKNFWLYGVLIAAIVAGGLYYFFRDESLDETRQESVVTRMAFSGSQLTEDQDGKRIWELTARVMEVDPNGRSSQEVVALWNYISDRLEKNFRRTVFAAPTAVAPIAGVQRPSGGFGRRVAGS